jgi:hypothetical protein
MCLFDKLIQVSEEFHMERTQQRQEFFLLTQGIFICITHHHKMYSIAVHHILLHVLKVKLFWCNFLQRSLTSPILVPNFFYFPCLFSSLRARNQVLYTYKTTVNWRLIFNNLFTLQRRPEVSRTIHSHNNWFCYHSNFLVLTEQFLLTGTVTALKNWTILHRQY